MTLRVFLAGCGRRSDPLSPRHLTPLHRRIFFLVALSLSLPLSLLVMTTPGYGVSGHQNAFSTGVKIGNYVEDRFGARRAATLQSQPLAQQSEAAASYIDPRAMPDKSAHAPPDNLVERAMVRAGLPYNLVFEHGAPHLPTRGELVAKYTPTSTDFGSGLVSRPVTLQRDETLRRHREIQRAKEAREARHSYVTTAQTIVTAPLRAHK
jgi:hypothetical protein